MQHRWLDESAPPKLSPAQAAMVQQNELLGPEPLSLDGAFNGAAAAAEEAKKAEPDLATPASAADAGATGPGIISPMVVDAAASVAEPDQAALRQHAPPGPRGRRGRAPAAGRGRKRKQVGPATLRTLLVCSSKGGSRLYGACCG